MPSWADQLLPLLLMEQYDMLPRFDTEESGWSIIYIEGSQIIISKILLNFFLWRSILSLQTVKTCMCIDYKIILFRPMEFSITFDIVMSGWFITYIEGSHIIISKRYCISFSEDRYSADPDAMRHYVAFHLGHQFLQKYPFRGYVSTKG